MSVAPYTSNIFKSEEIVARLAHLILENLHIDRWVFKIEGTVQGRGLGYLDLNTIKIFKNLKAAIAKEGKNDSDL